MGLRFRMKASYDISRFSPPIQIICAAMKKHGLIVADNGSNWYISGAPDPRWNDDTLGQLKTILGSAFEAVLTIDAQGNPIKPSGVIRQLRAPARAVLHRPELQYVNGRVEYVSDANAAPGVAARFDVRGKRIVAR
jgi:hypothetical protein